jgi:hypothetical protein
VLFTPLIALEKYAVRLTTAGKAKDQVETILSSIRRQRVTSIFYLPECPGQIEESILLLDDIHAHPLDDFLRVERQSIFTLNQSAFYLFLIKLSIHFCRFNEKIQRFDQI